MEMPVGLIHALNDENRSMTDSASIFLLTKIAPLFIYPVGMVIMLTMIGLIAAGLHRRRLAYGIFGAAATWLWVASTPMFANWAIATLEHQYPPQSVEKTPKADVAIVLGGAVSQPAPPRVELDLNKSSDRILKAARLFEAGRVGHVLVTGGNPPGWPDIVPEAELIRSLLIDWGVPAASIDIAGESRNTYENALEIKSMWKETPFDSALLVTSAAHMPRAMAVFEKAGLPVIASTTDIEALKGVPATALRWLPDASALTLTTVAMKEWLGHIAYRARGYI